MPTRKTWQDGVVWDPIYQGTDWPVGAQYYGGGPGPRTVLVGTGQPVLPPPPAPPAPPTWDEVAVDLNNKVGALIGQGDAWAATPNATVQDFVSAVYAYQQAGVAGATSVGPEIDDAGRPEITQKYTQAAWTLNSALAAVNATTSTAADVDLAAQYAKQMYGNYQTAIALGRSGLKSTGEVWNRGLILGVAGLALYAIVNSMRHEHRGSRARHR
jgi:hypothetical protein